MSDDLPNNASPSPAAPATPSEPAVAPSAEQIRLALRKVKDPELNLNIMDLGLVYDVLVEDATVVINMTLTSPGCPAGPQIMNDAERTVRAMDGVGDVVMNLVWEPYWSPEKMDPRVRSLLWG